MGSDVAGRIRVGVVAPGAADRAGLLENRDATKPSLLQPTMAMRKVSRRRVARKPGGNAPET
jgi:hypothetical protein